MTTKASALAFSAWLLREHPGVFATILKRPGVNKAGKLSGLGDDSSDIASALDMTDTGDVLQPVDVTASEILTPVDVTATSIPIDVSAANISTPSVVSSVGSNLGSAVSSVASFLLKGTAALAPVAVAAINAQSSAANRNAQLAVLGLQANRATAGISPANITYTANGTPVYVPSAPTAGGLTTLPAGLGAPVTLPNGQVGYTMTPQAVSNLSPTFLQSYGSYILIGGAALMALLLFS